MTAPAPPGIDSAGGGKGGACLRLLVSALGFAFVVVPLVQRLPLGPTTRFWILAWLLVGLALYWLFAGLGSYPLLILQLFLFSLAASALSGKALLVWIGIRGMGFVRDFAIGLLILGGVCATINLLYLLAGLVSRHPAGPPAG